MKPFHTNIERATLENQNYREVLYTAPHSQLVLMNLLPEQEIGMETHAEHDQFLRFEEGSGKVIIDGEEFEVSDGDAVIIAAGSEHNVINTSKNDPLKLYTIYSPPEHPEGTVQKEKV